MSHWLLDAIVHCPDLPLYSGSETAIGLSLWDSIPGTLEFFPLERVNEALQHLRDGKARYRAVVKMR